MNSNEQSKTPYKLLIVDDDPANMRLFQIALGETTLKDFECIHLSDGKHLLDYLQQNEWDDIFLILLDLNMPRIGGIEVLEEMAQNTKFKRIPVVVFTSSALHSDISSCYELGANAYVVKPEDLQGLKYTLQSIISFWRRM